MFDRILSAIISPVIFNLSVVIMLGVLNKKGYWFRVSLGDIQSIALGYTGQKLFLLFVLVPAIYGLIFGSKGVSEFIGHAFYSNMPEQKNMAITLSIWATILLTAYFMQSQISI